MAIRHIFIFAEAFFLLISHAEGLGYNRLDTLVLKFVVFGERVKNGHMKPNYNHFGEKFRLTLETNGKKHIYKRRI